MREPWNNFLRRIFEIIERMRWLKLSIAFSVLKCIGWSSASIIHFESVLEIKGDQSARGEGEETRLATAFPSNSTAFRSFLASSLSFSLSLPLSHSLFLWSRATVDEVDPPHESRAKKGTKRGREAIGGSRKEDEERGGIVGGVESISKLQATLFVDPLSPLTPLVSRHPPVAFSRFLPSGKATPPLLDSLSLSFSLSFSPFRKAARLEYWYRAKSFFP